MIPGLSLVLTLHFGGPAPARLPAADDRWLSSDKARHFLVSAFVNSLSYSVARSARVSREGALVTGAAVAAGVGVGKELYDRKSGGDPSVKDLVADGAGIAAATALVAQTR
jgi:putative lipoprotein